MGALPVTIVSGYLGAGKTTLVNQMLRQADGAKIAVLVNEFGELPIDEDLIEARDDELISIAGGCICCSFGSDLAAALKQMAEYQPRPDHIVIEASGVAMPGAIAQTVDLIPELRVEGICVLADSLNIRKMSGDEYIGDTIERQLSDADLILLSKADLVDQADLEVLQDWLAEHWPCARVVTAVQGQVPNAVLLGRFAGGETRSAGQFADDKYQSLAVRLETPVDARKLAQRLAEPSLGLVRAKGFVRDISGRPALIQLAGQRTEVTFPEKPGAAGLVCIGLKGRIDPRALQELGLGIS
ncbi:CobW family GTP-binding protein [Aestuariivita boseongensis]|uniref:CobW family GTP-binding protein n=1 Tax=Aestuariivita boseongensis TaxID=1470562 RepID=UPI00068356A5|nr:CobW family GTP-binding protein [Aestuariivita boseongensis]